MTDYFHFYKPAMMVLQGKTVEQLVLNCTMVGNVDLNATVPKINAIIQQDVQSLHQKVFFFKYCVSLFFFGMNDKIHVYGMYNC